LPREILEKKNGSVDAFNTFFPDNIESRGGEENTKEEGKMKIMQSVQKEEKKGFALRPQIQAAKQGNQTLQKGKTAFALRPLSRKGETRWECFSKPSKERQASDSSLM